MRDFLSAAFCATLVFVFPPLTLAEPDPNAANGAANASAAVVAPWITRPELYQARMTLKNLNTIKGDFGENLVSAHLKESGGWKQLSSGFGVHGPDHVTMKFDRDGRPRDAFFWDAKFGTSMPSSGQKSDDRLKNWAADLASDYRRVAAAELKRAPRDLVPTQRMDVETPGGRRVVAWKDDSQKVWLDAAPEHADDVRLHARRVAASLDGTATGEVRLRRRFIKIIPTDEGLRIGFSKPLVIPWDQPTVRGSLVDAIQQAIDYPIASADKRALAEKLADEAIHRRSVQVLSRPSRLARVGRGAAVGIVGAGLDTAIRLGEAAARGEAIDWGQVARGATVGGTSLVAAVMVEDHATVFTQRIASRVACGTSPATRMALSRLLSGAAGGGVAVVIYSYGGWAVGLHDITTANRGAVAGGIGVAGGAAAYASVTGLVGAFGTASTGTAIGSLSGAAANSATLAWLGGGSLAAGGGGAAVGWIILSGGTGIVIVAVGAGVMYYYNWSDAEDQRADCEARIKGLMNYFEHIRIAKQ